MPRLKKSTLSAYLRSGCQRQLRLSMYTGSEQRKITEELRRRGSGQDAPPPAYARRQSAGQLQQAGDDWQDQKVGELRRAFGDHSVLMRVDRNGKAIGYPLRDALTTIQPRQFVIEAEIDLPDAFLDAFGLRGLRDEYDRPLEFVTKMLGETQVQLVRPDIVQALRPMCDVDPLEESLEASKAVDPQGHLTVLPADDSRIRLRVCDVKLSSQPGAQYYAEVVYYSMILSAWLEEDRALAVREGRPALADRYVVVASAALWPGTYKDSALSIAIADPARRADPNELERALESDLEVAAFEVYVPSLHLVLREQLPTVLETPWQELPWHTSFRCQTCEFFGYRFLNKDGEPLADPDHRHCYEQAEGENLVKRVPGLTRATSRRLEIAACRVDQLADLPLRHAVFDSHRSLAQKRHVLRARARSLQTLKAARNASPTPVPTLPAAVQLVDNSGVSGSLPLYSNLDVYIFMDYDLSSALTVTFSMRARWLAPGIFAREGKRGTRRLTPPELAEVERLNITKVSTQRWGFAASKSGSDAPADHDAPGDHDVQHIRSYTPPPPGTHDRIRGEQEALLALLRRLKAIFSEVEKQDKDRAKKAKQGGFKTFESTYQIYLWDEAQYRHMTRLMSRHFDAIVQDPELRGLGWLFPSEQTVERPEFATRKSPISLVSEAVERHLAVPVPYQYTLLEVAESLGYTYRGLGSLFREPLTNLVPGERVHEYWSGAQPNAAGRGGWDMAKDGIERANRAKTLALMHVTIELKTRDKLVRDANPPADGFLADAAAPTLSTKTDTLKDVPVYSQLLFQFALLNANLQIMEKELMYARPATERVDGFASAFLPKRLEEGTEAYEEAWRALEPLAIEPMEGGDVWIYTLSKNSAEVKIKPGDFDLGLSPHRVPNFLDAQVAKVVGSVTVNDKQRFTSVRKAGIADVSVVAIDREGRRIALRLGRRSLLRALDEAGAQDFSENVMLDQIGRDHFTRKLRATLAGLGGPAQLEGDAAAQRALYDAAPAGHGTRQAGHDVLFQPALTHAQAVPLDLEVLAELVPQLTAENENLNDGQWAALQRCLARRLDVLWGPPGTGKSKTLRAAIRAAIAQARSQGRGLRVLIGASTYTAVDNVLVGLAEQLATAPDGVGVACYRLASETARAGFRGDHLPNLQSLSTSDPEGRDQALVARLDDGQVTDVVIVGTIHQQLYKLATMDVPYGTTAADVAALAAATQREWFDLIVIDEASQMDVAASTLLFSAAAFGAQVLIAGDGLQLPPIQPATPPLGLEFRVGSVYDFMVKAHGIEPALLHENYRSNRSIVGFTRRAGYDKDLHAHSPDLAIQLRPSSPITPGAVWPSGLTFEALLADMLDPAWPLVALVYDDEVSGQSNTFEALVASGLVALLHDRLGPPLHEERDTEDESWDRTYTISELLKLGVGVVAPHRAQGSLTVTHLGALLRPVGGTYAEVRGAVDTVERFQGGQRDVIIASFGLGDPDLIASEDEFLYDLKRFNVMVSRARAKVIVLLSRSVLHHLANDQNVARASGLLKAYVHQYCDQVTEGTLEYVDHDGTNRQQRVQLRRGRILEGQDIQGV